jgi:hypothetical protein
LKVFKRSSCTVCNTLHMRHLSKEHLKTENNPLFCDPIDPTMLSEPLLLEEEPVRKASTKKKVHWVDNTNRTSLLRVHSYSGKWDRTPIVIPKRPKRISTTTPSQSPQTPQPPVAKESALVALSKLLANVHWY